MSSTRHAKPGAPFSQFRYASAEEYKIALGGLLVSKRCALLEHDRELQSLIYFLQDRSLPDPFCTGARAGSLAAVAAELVDHAGCSTAAPEIFVEVIDFITGADSVEVRPSDAESSAERRASLVGALSRELCDLALSPNQAPEAMSGLGSRWRQVLTSYRKECDRKLRQTLAETSVRAVVDRALRFTRETRGISLVTCPPRHGKSASAKVFCGTSSGLSRYVLLPEDNDIASMYRAVGKAMGVGTSDSKRAADVRELVERTCALMHPHLVIDEAHHLFPSARRPTRDPQRVRWLRRLVDLGSTVSLIALPTWKTRLALCEKHLNWQKEELTDLITHVVHLPGQMTSGDFESVVEHRRPGWPESVKLAIQVAAEGQLGIQFVMVLRTGLEPARLTAHAPQTCVSTNSTT
jgi:hypothetical protein